MNEGKNSRRKLLRRILFQRYIRFSTAVSRLLWCNCLFKFTTKSRVLWICGLRRPPSTWLACIWMFLSPQPFIFGFKNFPFHVAYSNGTRPMVSVFTLENLDLCSVRDWTRFLLRRRIRKYPDSRSTGYQIRCCVCGFFLLFFFTLWRADLLKNIWIHIAAEFTECVLTEAVPTDSCGTGLRIPVC